MFDNARDTGSIKEIQSFRDTYFPKTSATKRIIITSQNANWEDVLQNQIFIKMEEWSLEDFIAFFTESKLINIDISQDGSAIETLHETFKGLPIAAALARSYMEKKQKGGRRYLFRNYVSLITDEKRRMSQYTKQLAGKREENLILALTLTYRSIEDEAVRNLFQILCCFAPEDIPIINIERKLAQKKSENVDKVIDFLPLLADEEILQNALDNLTDYSLLSTDGENYLYHRLIKDCLLFYLRKEKETELPYRQAEQISELVFDYPNNVPPQDKIGFYDLMSTHIAEIAVNTPDMPGDVIKTTLYQRRAMYLFHKGRNPEAYDLLGKAEALWQDIEPDTLNRRINRLKFYLDHLESRALENHIIDLIKARDYFDDLLKHTSDPTTKAEIREDLSQTNSYIGILSERWGNWKTAEDAYDRNFKLAEAMYQDQESNRYEADRKKKQEEFDKEYYMFHHHMGRLRWYQRKYSDSIDSFETSLHKQAPGGGKALTQMIYAAALGQAIQPAKAQSQLKQVFDVISTGNEFRRITYTAFYIISFAWDYKLPDFDLRQYLPYIETKAIKVYDPKTKSRVEKSISEVNFSDLKYQHIRRNIRLRQAIRSGSITDAHVAYTDINKQKFALKTLDELVVCYRLGDLAELIRFNDEGTITESALLDYAQYLQKIGDENQARTVAEQAFAITSYFTYHRDEELMILINGLGLSMPKIV